MKLQDYKKFITAAFVNNTRRDIETSNQRLINDDNNHRCVSYEGEIPFNNYLRIDNSDKEPDEVAGLIKEIFNL